MAGTIQGQSWKLSDISCNDLIQEVPSNTVWHVFVSCTALAVSPARFVVGAGQVQGPSVHEPDLTLEAVCYPELYWQMHPCDALGACSSLLHWWALCHDHMLKGEVMGKCS